MAADDRSNERNRDVVIRIDTNKDFKKRHWKTGEPSKMELFSAFYRSDDLERATKRVYNIWTRENSNFRVIESEKE